MNDRLTCDLCGCQPCMCQSFDCPGCEGQGRIEHPFIREPVNMFAECPPDPVWIDCEPCGGTGQAKCNGPVDGNCPFADFITGDWMCHCEAAWDRQQEALAAGDGPPTMREQQIRAQNERDALRGGRPQ